MNGKGTIAVIIMPPAPGQQGKEHRPGRSQIGNLDTQPPAGFEPRLDRRQQAIQVRNMLQNVIQSHEIKGPVLSQGSQVGIDRKTAGRGHATTLLRRLHTHALAACHPARFQQQAITATNVQHATPGRQWLKASQAKLRNQHPMRVIGIRVRRITGLIIELVQDTGRGSGVDELQAAPAATDQPAHRTTPRKERVADLQAG
jgi:hypothetical protein